MEIKKYSFKNQIKDIWFLWIYLSFVFISQIFLSFDGIGFYLLSALSVGVSYFLSVMLIEGLRKVTGSQARINNKGSLTIVRLWRARPYENEIKSFLICFVILFVYSLAIILFRNHMVADFFMSYNEAINNKYTNWHPVIFTLIFAKIPTLIFGNEKIFTYIFYELIRSLSLSLCITSIEKIAGKKIAIISLLYYMFMPLSIHSIASQTKGTAMGEFFIIGFYFILRYLYSENKNTKTIDDILVGLFFALSLLMRKNGLLFFIFIFVAIFVILPKKSFIKIVLSFFTTTILITKVLYSFFDITELPSSHNTHELLGLPLSIVSSFMKYDKEHMNEDEYEFARVLVNDKIYIYDSFNMEIGYHSIKWHPDFDNENVYKVFDKYKAKDVLKIAYDLTKKNPKLSFESIINIIKSVYGFRNWQGMTKTNGKILGKNSLISIYQFFLSIEVALINLFVIATIFAKRLLYVVNKKEKLYVDKNKLFKLCFSLAILMYSFGTMLLLSSSDSAHYFMINSMILPLYIICVYGENKNRYKYYK